MFKKFALVTITLYSSFAWSHMECSDGFDPRSADKKKFENLTAEEQAEAQRVVNQIQNLFNSYTARVNRKAEAEQTRFDREAPPSALQRGSLSKKISYFEKTEDKPNSLWPSILRYFGILKVDVNPNLARHFSEADLAGIVDYYQKDLESAIQAKVYRSTSWKKESYLDKIVAEVAKRKLGSSSLPGQALIKLAGSNAFVTEIIPKDHDRKNILTLNYPPVRSIIQKLIWYGSEDGLLEKVVEVSYEKLKSQLSKARVESFEREVVETSMSRGSIAPVVALLRQGYDLKSFDYLDWGDRHHDFFQRLDDLIALSQKRVAEMKSDTTEQQAYLLEEKTNLERQKAMKDFFQQLHR